MDKVPLEKFIVSQLLSKNSALRGTRWLITLITRLRHWYCSEPDESSTRRASPCF